jgi:hypothetical protein
MNAEVTSNDGNGGFSRRRVVKGVAWSVPVIVTAIAAPAAAASGISAAAALVNPVSDITLTSSTGTGSGTSLPGTGPTAFQIHNTGSAITGAITGTVNIKPSGTVTAGAGVGIQSINAAAPASSAYTGTHEYNATFTYAGTIASGQTLPFPLVFQYERITPGPKKGAYAYTLTITLRLPDGTDRIMTGAVTITY